MGIEKLLKLHRRIMFDTAPVVYFIEEHKEFGEITDKIFRLVTNDINYHAFSSVITLIEVLTQPLKKEKREVVEKYQKFLLNSK